MTTHTTGSDTTGTRDTETSGPALSATVLAMYPRLVVAGASEAIEFYTAAFAAVETERYTDPTGKVVHAALAVGPATIAVKDEGDGDPAPTSLGGSPVIVALYVSDADAVADAMVAAGARVVYPVSDQPYGERGGRLEDPFGHLWMISQRVEDLTPEEIQRRTQAMFPTAE